TRTRSAAAEHAAQNVFEAPAHSAAGACIASTLEAVRAPGERFEVALAAEPAAARLSTGAETLKATEARLALGVDFAAVKGLALLVIAEDFVRGVELGEAGGRLGVVLVGVGMQLLGKLPEGALDVAFARTLRYPQNLVGVAHSRLSPVKAPRRLA